MINDIHIGMLTKQKRTININTIISNEILKWRNNLYKYNKRVKNRQKLYNKLKKLGR